jgi:uncharacterized repeat protein (TIGR01451 family)
MLECRLTLAILQKGIAFYMNKLLITILSVAFLAIAGTASAAGNTYGGYGTPCEPIYGGGEVCVSKGQILINKTVKNPTTGAFVDNLSLSNDPKYGANQTVEFKLTLTNTGDETLKEVTVTDTFPSYIVYESGTGTYDSKNKTLTFKVNDLKANEARTYVVKGKIVGSASLPTDQAITCVVNQAKAKASENESSDVSQFCIQKEVVTTKGGLPVMPAPKMTQTPPTGPEMLSLAALIPAAGAGIFLRRRSK